MELQIRLATADDLADVLALYADVDGDTALTLEQARAIFDKMGTYPDYKLYVVEYDGRTVGTFTLAVMDNLAHGGEKSGLIEDVIVRADMRSRGVGARMMEHAISVCRGKDCYKVSLSSNRIRERAHAFYDRIGFQRHGYSFKVDLK